MALPPPGNFGIFSAESRGVETACALGVVAVVVFFAGGFWVLDLVFTVVLVSVLVFCALAGITKKLKAASKAIIVKFLFILIGGCFKAFSRLYFIQSL